MAGALALVSLHLHAQPNLTGNWVAETPREDGTFARSYFNLRQEGSHIVGSIRTSQFYFEISASTGGPDNFTLTGSQPDGKTERHMQLEGKMVGDELHLTAHFRPNAPPVELVAHRTKKGAGGLPAPLPLPALHKVPYNGLAKTPPMGWNSWNKFNRRVSDEVVRGVADAMASNGMRDAGYIYVNIDDTWEGDRDANGKIQTNKKFPDMKALADYVHSKGMKLGIYSSPGPNTCAGYEGSYGHEQQDAQTYAAWGIDYLKYDWCGARTIYKDDAMQALYQKMGDALQASGRPIVYSLCQYGRAEVWKWGPDVGGNLWRTTGDISDHWESLVKIGFNQSDLAPYAAPGHWNDPDMLEIGNGGMSDVEYKTHMSLWSMLASPLMAGNDVRDMSPAIRDILMNHEVIAIDQDPDGKQGQRVSADGDQEIWLRPLAGGAHAVALFNRSAASSPMKVDWSKLGLPQPPKQARDVWEHKDVSLDGPEFTTTVPSHGVVLLRVGS
jgi:alpha-galactosidase